MIDCNKALRDSIKAEGAAAERAKIVAIAREQAGVFREWGPRFADIGSHAMGELSKVRAETLETFADAIEHGDHTVPTDPVSGN